MNKSRLQFISGNTLKIIACVSMIIDHVAAGLILPVYNNGLYRGNLDFKTMSSIYTIMRGIGRTAFPIFCFLLVEGFVHTKSRLKYALSLLIFGLISEIPFDLIFFSYNEEFNINIIEALRANSDILNEQCNVYFTLLIGLLTIWAIDACFKQIREKELPSVLTLFSCPIILLIGCVIAYKVNSDYDFYGVILIFIFYMLKKHDYLRLIAGLLFIANLSSEIYSFPGFILMAMYNHKRGRNLGKLKYIFYIYYPAHLILIYVYRCLMFGGR